MTPAFNQANLCDNWNVGLLFVQKYFLISTFCSDKQTYDKFDILAFQVPFWPRAHAISRSKCGTYPRVCASLPWWDMTTGFGVYPGTLGANIYCRPQMTKVCEFGTYRIKDAAKHQKLIRTFAHHQVRIWFRNLVKSHILEIQNSTSESSLSYCDRV